MFLDKEFRHSSAALKLRRRMFGLRTLKLKEVS